MATEQLLRKLYYNIESPASFSSAERLYAEAKQFDKSIKLDDVKKFLSGELTFTLHRRVVRKFKRNPVVASRHGEQGQADLIDIQKYKKENNNISFILTVIDVFSKFAHAIPLKSKSAADVANAFKALFKTYRPLSIQKDEDKEFTCKAVQTVFKQHLVKWFLAKNEKIKCAVVERFQRTIMTRINKYLTSKGTHSFVDLLPKFLTAYNNSYHRSIKTSPLLAVLAPAELIFKNLYGFENERALLRNLYAKPKVSEGVPVRVAANKSRFAKGYSQNFTDEIYTIDKAMTGVNRPVYRLKDHKDKVIKGNFYPDEIQQIEKKDLYRVQVLAERKRGRGKQYLVHYENFPDSDNEWIPASRLRDIS